MRFLLFVATVLWGSTCPGQDLTSVLKQQIAPYRGEGAMSMDTTRAQVFLHNGSVLLPAIFTNKRTGTVDSERGELRSTAFVIYYDIGSMAGQRMNVQLKGQCSVYEDGRFNGVRMVIGLQGNQMTVSILSNNYPKDSHFPANFWAKVENAKDVSLLLQAVMSYHSN